MAERPDVHSHDSKTFWQAAEKLSGVIPEAAPISGLPEIGYSRPACGCPESMPPVGLKGKCAGCGFRAPAFGRPRNDQEEFFSSR
jgi:hypothetical protein